MGFGRKRSDNRKAKILIFNGFWPFLGLYQTSKMVEAAGIECSAYHAVLYDCLV